MEEISAYEQERNENIARNKAFLASIGLGGPEEKDVEEEEIAKAFVVEDVDEGAVLRDLKARWPARDRELDALCGVLLCGSDAPILVGGSASTGKSSVVRACLEAFHVPHARIGVGD